MYGIASEHRGAVTVQSSPGHGSLFTVFLPVSQTPLTTAPADDQQPIDVAADKKPNILVIDDENDLREMTQSSLEDLGFCVTAAASGRQGIERMAIHQGFDVVILDMLMPEMDGPTTFTHIRTLIPEMPVVICSGFAQHDAIDNLTSKNDVYFLKNLSDCDN